MSGSVKRVFKFGKRVVGSKRSVTSGELGTVLSGRKLGCGAGRLDAKVFI